MSIDAFIEPDVLIVDRSTLERFAECPAQARFIETGKVLNESLAMQSGEAIHRALGTVLSEYIDCRGSLAVADLTEQAMQELAKSRPDIQKDAIEGARASLWAWARYVSQIHPDNILHYDGGEGDRSGQLAWDMEHLGVRLTSELDLLHTGRAPEVLTEIDYKTGQALWTAADVENSFQFAMHAWLVLHNYPEVNTLVVRVWNTRRNRLTYGCEWNRGDLYALTHRLESTVKNWLAHKDKAPEHSEAWPEVERCSMCPAAAFCPAVPSDMQSLASDPVRLVDLLTATEAKAAKLAEMAAAIVDRDGRDILTPSGNAFGVGKPKRETKPRKGLYQVAEKDE